MIVTEEEINKKAKAKAYEAIRFPRFMFFVLPTIFAMVGILMGLLALGFLYLTFAYDNIEYFLIFLVLGTFSWMMFMGTHAGISGYLKLKNLYTHYYIRKDERNGNSNQ